MIKPFFQIEKDQDCEFFKEQQTTWRAKFQGVDKNYTKKCVTKFQRSQRYVQQKDHGKNDIEINNISSSTNSSTNSSTISNKSDERMRINSESSNEDFEHLEPLELVDIKRYRDLTER